MVRSLLRNAKPLMFKVTFQREEALLQLCRNVHRLSHFRSSPAARCIIRLVIDNNIKMHHPIRFPSTSGTCELPVENDADVSAVLVCGCICGASSLFLEYNPRTPSGPRMNSSNSYPRLYWRSDSGREPVAFLGSIDVPHRVQNFPHVGGSMWEVRLILWEVRSISWEVRFNLDGGLTWRHHIHVASCPYHLSP